MNKRAKRDISAILMVIGIIVFFMPIASGLKFGMSVTDRLYNDKGEIICSDTDSGYNVFVQGHVLLANGSLYTEYCNDTRTVVEYFCNNQIVASTGGLDWGLMQCPEGCVGGACKDFTTPECYDEDPTDNIYEKTYLEINYTYSNYFREGVYRFYDKCIGQWLVEYHCAKGDRHITGFSGTTRKCDFGCVDGACVFYTTTTTVQPETTTTTQPETTIKTETTLSEEATVKTSLPTTTILSTIPETTAAETTILSGQPTTSILTQPLEPEQQVAAEKQNIDILSIPGIALTLAGLFGFVRYKK